MMTPAVVYILCLITSVVCMALLARGYMRTRVKLLFWSAWCFVFLGGNNLFLLLDTIVFPDVYLKPMRLITTGLALTVLLYGLIWEAD